MTYTILGASVTQQNPGELGLRLSIRMTNDGPYPANFWDDSFRLLIGGVPQAPTGGLNSGAEAHSAQDGAISFDNVPVASARKLVLSVHYLGGAPSELPLTLRGA